MFKRGVYARACDTSPRAGGRGQPDPDDAGKCAAGLDAREQRG
jgi:hypothetical protein